MDTNQDRSNRPVRVLHLEDNPRDVELIHQRLKTNALAFDIVWVDGKQAFESALARQTFDLVIVDYNLPHYDGMSALARVREQHPELPVILVSGTLSEEEAVECLKAGANDYVLKQRLQRLDVAVTRALQEAAQSQRRHQAEEALRESEERFRATFEQAAVGMALRDVDPRNPRWLRVNQKLCEILGYTREELLQLTSVDITPPEDRDVAIDYNEQLLRGEITRYSREKRYVRKDGQVIWASISLGAAQDTNGRLTHIISTIQDITERKRLERVRRVMGSVSSAIIRVRDQQQLFEEACRIAVDHGMLKMAWIGMPDPATQSIRPSAWANLDEEFLRRLQFSAREDEPGGRRAVGKALRTGKPVWDNDIATSSPTGPVRRYAIEHGIRSMIALPLLVEARVEGVFSLYAKEAGFFTTEEVRLLEEMASNISFALGNLARQQKLVRLARTRAVSSSINSAIVRSHGRQDLFREACRIAVEDGQFPFAWIGVHDPATQDVTPVAWAGDSAEGLTRATSSARDNVPQGRGAVGQAIRERRVVFNNDIAARGFGGPRLRAILALGYRSQITLPLLVGGMATGALTMYAKEPGYFDEEELRLLSELAGNISFALEAISRQESLDKLSRIRAVMREVNAVSVRIRNRETLLREICRIAVEHGKFELVWVGSLDQEKQRVEPVAWAGFSHEIAHAIDWASLGSPQVTLNEVMRTRQVAVRNDLESEQRVGILRLQAWKRDYCSSACLPFLVDDSVVGAIILFAKGRGFFDTDEIALLNELSADVSFALQSIAKQETLEYLSYYDTLTGLPNRHLFVDRLSQQMRSRSGDPQMVALILLDLERFRNVNESLGHRGGDELLVTIARRLEHAFRGRDYLARISSNGFGIIVRGISGAADVVHVIENDVYACFGSWFPVSDRELRVSAKTGIAMFPTDGQDADTLFRNAEAALNRAKASGDRYLFYAAKMNAEAAHLVTLESRLRVAVEKQQFVLHYQPKFDTRTRAMTGLEALIRWADPDKGLLPPAQFIPLLEQTGMILEVGQWALQQALADFQRWQGDGLTPPRIAVNVSAIQLRQNDFVEMLRSLMTRGAAAGGKEGCGLDLEITESLVMEDIEQSIAKLKAVRELGLGVYIDDFGTGYSSLSYIARLPIDALKIDRVFVDGMAVNPHNMTIVSTIISLAHALNLSVVAEGVETAEQHHLLALLKCDEVQGYLLSRPVPAEQIERLLREQKTLPG